MADHPIVGGIILVLLIGAAVSWYVPWHQERKRVRDIRSRQKEWGGRMCDWLVANGYSLADSRTKEVMKRHPAWGTGTCQRLLQRKIAIRDSKEMVLLAFGQPTSEDQKVTTASDQSLRWIYGTPRHGAKYIWFKNGLVSKMKL